MQLHSTPPAGQRCVSTGGKQARVASHVCQVARSHGMTRRAALSALIAAPLVVVPRPGQAKPDAGDWSSPGLATPVDDTAPKFYKTDSGIKIQELKTGTGPAPQAGDTVLIDYVLRRPNGYFIYATVEGVSFQPKDVPVAPIAFTLTPGAGHAAGRTIPGLQEVVSRMAQGGRVRALIPPEQGYADCATELPQPPTFATKRQLTNHCREPLLFEIALLRVTPGKK